IASERGRVHNTTVHPAERLLINLASRHNCAARDVTTTQRLCERDDVWLQIPMLKSKHFSGAAKSRLHFVGNQQRSVLRAKFLRMNEKNGVGPFVAIP